MEYKPENEKSFFSDREIFGSKYYKIIKATKIGNKLVDIKVIECEKHLISSNMIPIDDFVNREYYYENVYELVPNVRDKPKKLKGYEHLAISELDEKIFTLQFRNSIFIN